MAGRENGGGRKAAWPLQGGKRENERNIVQYSLL